MIDRIVIVGGGLAAARVAHAFRDAGGEASVTMLSADTDPPYNRPPLSKGLWKGKPLDSVWRHTEQVDLAIMRLRTGSLLSTCVALGLAAMPVVQKPFIYFQF